MRVDSSSGLQEHADVIGGHVALISVVVGAVLEQLVDVRAAVGNRGRFHFILVTNSFKKGLNNSTFKNMKLNLIEIFYL